MTTTVHEKVAQATLDCFASLPQKCKPRSAVDGREEWTPLAAVVAVVSRGSGHSSVKCVSLATGTKCIAANALHQCAGTVIHDSHAEILALRGFNRWLLQEIQSSLRQADYVSPYIQRQDVVRSATADARPFRIADNVSLHFFTTEAPCGDASMDLLIGTKSPEDALPWDIDEGDSSLPGRGHFSQLGRVRRKPARADAPVSLSKSCSDKLSVKQVTSVLSFPTDLLIQETDNAFLSSLTVPAGQYNEVGFSRAFGPDGRIGKLEGVTPRFFDCIRLPETFPDFRFKKRPNSATPCPASNVSAIYISGGHGTSSATIEVLLNGVKQGFKQFDIKPRKQSVVCRKQMWLLGLACLRDVNQPALLESCSTYAAAKVCPTRALRHQRKASITDALGNWIKNTGDGSWTLD